MSVEQLCYSTDGTLEGLLTALAVALAAGDGTAAADGPPVPQNILIDHPAQTALFQADVPILTDLELAGRLQQRIIQRLGIQAYHQIKLLYLAEKPERGGVALRYLGYLLPRGRQARDHLAQPAVAAAWEITQQVQKEANWVIEFLRFADVGGGLFYAHIQPKANVVPLVMGHFAARFNIQPFVIQDSLHNLSGVYDGRHWWLAEGLPQALSPGANPAEDQFSALWQRFYKTIAIAERRNPTLQRNLMPKRFWGDLCEQQLPYERRGDCQTLSY